MAEKQRARLGAAMRARRHDLDLSPGYVAEKLFISGKTLERWERGETMGGIRNVDKVAAVLDTTADALLAGPPTEQEPTPDPFNGTTDLADVVNRLAAIESRLATEFRPARQKGSTA